MIRVAKENHIHVMSRNNVPCAKANPGDSILLEVWDSLEGRSLEYYKNHIPYDKYASQTNPATGPIYVKGALPGDVLDVRIDKISLFKYGYIVLEKYLLDKTHKNPGNVHLELEIDNGALLYGNARLPLEPMIGVIGTAPLKDMRVHDPGAHGGNMDAKIVGEGARVLLPVFTEGALLAVGDVHAVMGEGEVFFQGVEVGADIELRVDVIKGLGLKRPMVITNSGVACVASHRSIMTAESQVIEDMGYYLTEVLRFDIETACAIIAFYGNLCFCQVANPIKTIRLELLQKYMDAFQSRKALKTILVPCLTVQHLKD